MPGLNENQVRARYLITISNKELDEKIRTIFKKHQSRYGAQRITDELRDNGETCSKNRVAKG